MRKNLPHLTLRKLYPQRTTAHTHVAPRVRETLLPRYSFPHSFNTSSIIPIRNEHLERAEI